MYPFERFTERAKAVLTHAQEEAEASGHSYIGTEHQALARLLDVRRLKAAKEQAIATQDYEAASGHRTAERQARRTLDQAIAAWRQELEPPQEGAS